MIMNKYYKKLEFDQIIDKLKDFAVNEVTKKEVDNLQSSNDLEYLNEILSQTDEALCIINRLERAPLMISNNYEKFLNITSKGGVLSAFELYDTIRLYSTIKANQKLLINLQKENIECKYYQSFVESLVYHQYIDEKLKKSINEDGEIFDDASPNLKNIRQKLKNIESRIKSKLQEIINKDANKLSQLIVTIRNGCYCLPVRAEYKNSFPGTIIDQSASSQTVYIEPLAIGNMKVEIANLLNLEKEEIEKILRELSRLLTEYDEELRNNFKVICYIDNVFARAMLAQSYQGSKPKINKEGTLNLVNARHPLLKVKKVIPNNVSFGDKYYGIIITGPNTGGKTVLIKTVGLLSIMIKYGLLIPADASSNIMIYDNIYCDIGDDQSIQNNLSTFSSHIGNISQIIDNVTPNSLALFDEIGSGTDPIEGSNLAVAILKYLINKKVSFITTTHYSELKNFGFNEEHVINASMEFNDQTLEPTYRLVLGISGSSNAFNIARRLGLKNEIIENAENLAKQSDTEERHLIQKLEQEYLKLSEERTLLNKKIAEYEKTKAEYELKIEQLEKDKERILKKVEAKYKEEIEYKLAEIDEILEELNELKNRKDIKLHEIIDVKSKVSNVKKVKEQPKKVVKKNKDEKIEVGDNVFVSAYGQYGIVQKILKDGKYQVAIGNILIKLSKEELSKVETVVEEKDSSNVHYISDSNSRVSLTLDLRGERYDTAKDKLEKYIDDLIIHKIHQATIIHGYGTGVIRELVQNFVKNNKNIASYRYGGENEGGFGVTIITLK